MPLSCITRTRRYARGCDLRVVCEAKGKTCDCRVIAPDAVVMVPTVVVSGVRGRRGRGAGVTAVVAVSQYLIRDLCDNCFDLGFSYDVVGFSGYFVV